MGTKVKIVVLGDGNVGKSYLIHAYMTGNSPNFYIPTVLESYTKKVTHADVSCELLLFDTGGDEGYDRFLTQYCEGASCFLLCFSIDSKVSYRNVLKRWRPNIRRIQPDTPIVLVGTKSDLRSKIIVRQDQFITKEEGLEMTKRISAVEYFECSAFNNEGIAEIIHSAIRHSQVANRRSKNHRSCAVI